VMAETGQILRLMPEEPKPDLPASPHGEGMIVRLRDLDRLRELIEPYVTDSSADYRYDALPHMPAAERAEAEEIIARIGMLDPTLAALQEKLLGLLGEIEVFYREVLDRERARGARADPEELRQAQDILAALERYRSQVTGLKPGDVD
jgi:hypothetical protein